MLSEIVTMSYVFISDFCNRVQLCIVHSLIFSMLWYCLLQNTVFGGKPMAPDYNHIPCAVFWYYNLFLIKLYFNLLSFHVKMGVGYTLRLLTDTIFSSWHIFWVRCVDYLACLKKYF